MPNVNFDRLVQANSERSNILTPLIEAIVNSLESIKDSGRDDGEIEIIFYRQQANLGLGGDDDLMQAQITDITIIDNGVGFNDDNYNSFFTLHSDYKQLRGGKGFGRIFYRQYFNTVNIESIYNDDYYSGQVYRNFNFTKHDFIDEEIYAELDEQHDIYTKVSLINLKAEERNKLDRRLDTIARKILEHLLRYFLDDGYKCPKIILRDDSDGSSITLNDFFEKSKEIVTVASETFQVVSYIDKKSYEFKVKIFKIFFSKSNGKVYLTAHQRVVTKTPIADYSNVFKDGFYEETRSEKGTTITRNYIVAAYVSGDFLDQCVSGERGEFLIKSDNLTISPITVKNIEERAVEITAKYFGKDVSERTNKKVKLVSSYVGTEAPWLREFVKDLDLNRLNYDAKPDEINTELEQVKHERDLRVKKEIKTLINEPPKGDSSIEEAMKAISDKVTTLGKSDLIQHIVLRKAVLDLFSKALEWDADKKYNKEDAVHTIIFPLKNTSDDLSYEKHNLWMIDERLSFHNYAASDLGVKKKGDRPDIVVFDNPILVRDSDTISSAINIVEFKRPQRKGYSKDDDPLKQVSKYVKQIRSGKYITKDGIPVSASENSPAYGFVIADLTDKVREFCSDAQLTEDPDKEGYHGFHSKWNIYFEVVSFKKLLTNAELRNKILFTKLGIV